MVYYAFKSRDGHVYLIHEQLNASLMSGDYLLFDSADDCISYWAGEGVQIDRFA